MRRETVAVLKEVRHYTIRDFTNVIKVLKQEKNCPMWLKDEYYNELLRKRKEVEISQSSNEDSALTIDDSSTSFTSIKKLDHKYINSGVYGPEISEYTMPLPANYPTQAGMAVFTLRHQLEEYELQLSKLKLRKMPSTLEEVYEPTIQDKINDIYHSIRQTKLKMERIEVEKSVTDEVKVAVLSNYVYPAGRRESCIRLTGLQPHYPNPYCEYQAVISTFPPSGSNKNSMVDKNSIVVETKIFPPAGRKPNNRQLVEFSKFGFVREKEVAKKKNGIPAEIYLGRRGSNHKAPGLEEFSNAITNTVTTVDVTEPSEGESSLKNSFNESLTQSTSIAAKTGLLRRFKMNGLELAHHGSVNDIVFSPSETRIATAGGDSLIKLWDPRDGSYVRRLRGHSNEVFAVRYSNSEQFLVSSGADSEVIIWSMLTLSVLRRLLGHSDVVYSISISPDVSVICSGSHDQIIKTWYTTPRHPDPPDPPRVIAVTDTTEHVKWTSPPCFNLDVNAFHLQYRIGTKESWFPEDGISIAPQFRSLIVRDIIGATPYQV